MGKKVFIDSILVRPLKYFKKWLKYNSYEIKWIIAISLVNVLRLRKVPDQTRETLLLPAADLDGGFGEDLMVSAFVSLTKPNEKIDILTSEGIRRDDYLGRYPNISYLNAFKTGNYFRLLSLTREYKRMVVLGADVLDGFHSFHNSMDRLRLVYFLRLEI